MDQLELVTEHTARIAFAVDADPTAEVAVYAPWTLADLARHVGQIHAWVTGIVRERLEERPAFPEPDVADAELATWLTAGAEALVAALADTDPATPLWTFDRSDRTATFWRRRMALETIHHAWDADTALGRPTAIPAPMAVEAVQEVLRVYTAPRLRTVELGGGGARVAVVPDGSPGWTVTLQDVGMGVDDGVVDPAATITGDPAALWLLLTSRTDLTDVTVHGDATLAARLVTITDSIPGPTG